MSDDGCEIADRLTYREVVIPAYETMFTVHASVIHSP